METAGLAFGVVGVAGLFSVCMDILDGAHSFKEADKEQRQVHARFQAEKIRLKEWGNGVGISDGELKNPHDGRLDDSEKRETIGKILLCVGEALGAKTEISPKMRADFQDENPYSVFGAGNQLDRTRGSKKTSMPQSKRAALAWSMVRKRRSKDDVDSLKALVDVLYSLVPLNDGPSSGLTRRATGLEDHHMNRNLHDSSRTATDTIEINKLLESVRKHNITQEQKSIDEWLGIPSLKRRYEDYLESHIPGTCDWILRTPAYEAWISNGFQGDTAKLLWIHGPAGHGKTILNARLVQQLENEHDHLVVHFFASRSQAEGKIDNIIRHWLAQLVRIHPKAHELALDYTRHHKAVGLASQANVWDALKSIVFQEDHFIFALDGLDEYDRKNDNRQSFLRKLKTTFAHGRNRVLITSRDEADIRQELSADWEGYATPMLLEHRISVEDVQSDVSLFAREIVERRLPGRKSNDQRDLAARMAQKCEGMFLWIKLQQDQLRPRRRHKELRQIIAKMPSELSGAYERNWKTISNLPTEDRERAERILLWTLYSFRPLTVSELAEALDIELNGGDLGSSNDDVSEIAEDKDSSDEAIEIDDKYIDEEILNICGSLVETQAAIVNDIPGSRTVHLVHFSVKEYLKSLVSGFQSSGNALPSLRDGSLAHLYLAKVCLRYLSEEGVWEKRDSRETSKIPGAFLGYAAASWYLHVNAAKEKDDELVCLTTNFLHPSNLSFDSWRQHFESAIEKHQPKDSESKIKPSSALYYAALFNLTWAMESLREKGLADLDTVGSRYGTALQAVCAKGHGRAFELLIGWGANINTEGGEFGTPINAAAVLGRKDIFLQLLDAGASLLSKDSMGRTPLYTACKDGHLEIAQELLKAEADINTPNTYGWTPLNSAADSGHLEVVKLLLEKGADFSVQGYDGWTPLYAAANSGYLKVVNLLLEKGADFSVLNNDGWTPLNSAAYSGYLEVVNLLLEKGADFSVPNNDGITPLNSAAYRGHLKVVKLLLEKGADFSVLNNDGWTPLYLAANSGHLEVVNLLLEKGADFSVQDNDGWTPLNSAAKSGYLKVVKLLLEKGADFSVPNNDGWTTLNSAADSGHLEVVNLLLEKGVDFSVPYDC